MTRLRAFAFLALLVACRTSVPTTSTVDAASAPARDASADAAKRLHALCEAASRALPKTATPEHPSEAIDPELAARFVKLVRPLLPARLRKEEPEVFAVHPVRGGHLVELTAADPESEAPSSRSSFLAFVASAGGGRLLANEQVLKRADFDGDGKAEPITQHCSPKPLFARECTFTTWFPAREVTFTRLLLRGLDVQVREQEKHADVWLVPADGVEPDFFAAEDILVVSFTPAGTKTSDGAAIYARDAATAKLRYALEACEEKLRQLDEARWERRVRALGATDAESPGLARYLVQRWKTSPDALPRDPAEPITTRGMLDKRFPDPKEDAAIWAALPRPVSAHCGALPAAMKDAWSREREAVVRHRADTRFSDVVTPVEVSYGCTTREGTLALVAWAEEAYFEAMWTTELHLLRAASSELVASTRSQWVAEYHHIYDLALGPSADFDGDGEDETLVIGTEHEVGMGGRERIGAIWKNGALRQVPEATPDRILVTALDPSHPAIVLTSGPYAPKDKLWPPKVFTLDKDAFRPAKVPPAWTTATKSGRDAFEKLPRGGG